MQGKLRLRFSKTGKAKYISHLDLMSTMRRALLRTGVDLTYTKGYNPHPYLSIAVPLSIGCGSVCELMDFGVEDENSPNLNESLPSRITDTLPEGLEVVDVYKSINKFNNITWIELDGVLYYDNEKPRDIAELLLERFTQKSIIISKRTKRGVSDVDIAPHTRNVSFVEDGTVHINVIVSAQNPTINTDNILSALEGSYSTLAPDFALFTRKEVYDIEMKVFR